MPQTAPNVLRKVIEAWRRRITRLRALRNEQLLDAARKRDDEQF